MISGPPGFSAILNGITYGFELALRKVDPNDASIHPNGPVAINQAIWFRFMITVLNGSLVMGFTSVSSVMMFVMVVLIDTLAYPVVSHAILFQNGMGARFPSFITSYTWVGNLRVLLVMTLTLLSSFLGTPQLQIMLLPIGLWMIWASWSVATLSLQRGGLAGAGMVVLSMLLEVIILMAMLVFINPEMMS
ncbi:MAG: hypothetical protein J4F41_05800 [Alphaproteobacteria bacterium]|nr:hypothetical protein [Alphaproteobacteria bacterium]